MLRTLFIICSAFVLSATARAGETDTLVILSPHWEGMRYEIEQGFRDWNRKTDGRETVFVWQNVGGTSEILRFILSEFSQSPTGIGVDLVFGGGTDPYEMLASKELLQPFTPAPGFVEMVPQNIDGLPIFHPKYLWTASHIGAFGILCNLFALNRLGLAPPKKWSELAEPRYFDTISAADPRKSGSMHIIYEALLQSYGWNEGWGILVGMGANVRTFAGSASQINQEVADGNGACALAVDSYATALRDAIGEEHIAFILPNDVRIISGDGLAMLKGAPHAAAANSFIQYVVSPAGQKIFSFPRGTPGGPVRYDTGRLPIQPSLYKELPKRLIDPFEEHGYFRYDAHLGNSRWKIVNDLFGEFIIEGHELHRAARATHDEDALRRVMPPYPESDIGRWAVAPEGALGKESRKASFREDNERRLAEHRNIPLSQSSLPSILTVVFAALIFLRRRIKL